jgi:predicted dithiol-disulfide oxidoreductase (DUF899 family)
MGQPVAVGWPKFRFSMTKTLNPPLTLVQGRSLVERGKLLGRLNAERGRLPMVRIEKDYVFDGPGGKRSLAGLFDGRLQLIVYHFMFAPAWDQGCPGCTGYIDALGDLSMLNDRDTTFVLVSLAPLAKLEAYKAQKGWNVPWFSSFPSDFNNDCHATRDRSVAPAKEPKPMEGEEHGHDVFFRLYDDVFHTYSAYARGSESLMDGYRLLDMTRSGRQPDFEDSPSGWTSKPDLRIDRKNRRATIPEEAPLTMAKADIRQRRRPARATAADRR